VSGGSTENGANIQLWDCYLDHPNMVFSLPSSGTGMIRWAANTSKCFYVSGGGSESGSTLHLWDCDETSPNMQFEVPDDLTGAIRWAGKNKCMDVAGGRLALGTDIQLWDCNEAHDNMRFVVRSCAETPTTTAGETTTTITTTTAPTTCHTAVWPEACFQAVTWAMTEGFSQHPEWYPGLTADSGFEDFQRLLNRGGHGQDGNGEANYEGCREPCKATPTTPAPTTTRGPSPSPTPSPPYASTGQKVGQGWCAAEVPVPSWSLMRSCGHDLEVKVLTYNLFWWNLFGVREGNGGSAGKLIADNGPFDIMGFQECDDIYRVLNDAGLGSSYSVLPGARALGTAYKTADWEELSSGILDVAEDRPEQYYGRRAVQWGRLRHRASGKVIFFLNHHGALQVNTGGVCGGEATAYNILRVVRENSQAGDAVVVLGDTNNDAASVMQGTLMGRLTRVTANWVDAIFTSCEGSLVTERNLGNGGSDHNALEAVFRV